VGKVGVDDTVQFDAAQRCVPFIPGVGSVVIRQSTHQKSQANSAWLF
jgi:hypothetical protein